VLPSPERRRHGFRLCSERYDREMKDVFDIQDDISRAIVASLSSLPPKPSVIGCVRSMRPSPRSPGMLSPMPPAGPVTV
jgi:hypothetical protein